MRLRIVMTGWLVAATLVTAAYADGCSGCNSPANYATLGLYASPLGGVDRMQVNLATVLALGVWRDLRRPLPGDGPSAERSAVVYWPEQNSSIVDSPEQARRSSAPLILWGKAGHYGSGYIVDSYLSAPYATEMNTSVFHGSWFVDDRKLWLGLPREVFTLGAISLSDDLVNLYSSPGVLHVCFNKEKVCTGGTVVGGLTANIQEPDWANVVTFGGIKGWIYLPRLTKSHVTRFASAVLAYYRGEFRYAEELFSKVASDNDSPESLRADAQSLAFCARSRVDPASAASAADSLAKAAASSFDAEAAIMNRLELADRAHDPGEKAAATKQAEDYLLAHQGIFEPNDPWFVQALKVLVMPHDNLVPTSH